MSNVLSEEEKQQVIALGRLGCSLRKIQKATLALRPRESPNSMPSRCGSQALADELLTGGSASAAATWGCRQPYAKVGVTPLAGFAEGESVLGSAGGSAEPESGVTSLVDFAGAAFPQAPGGRRAMPAARR